MSNTPIIFSVIVPVLNSSGYLHTCLNSILQAANQFGNAKVELIVVDNGSTDGSYELLLNEYASHATVQQFRDITVGALRNRGVALSSGEFLSFIDSDCEIHPDYFERAEQILRTSADATGCQVDIPDQPHWIEKTWHEVHARPQDGIVNYINSGNFVIKRSVFLSCGGFDESMIGTEDAELCQRLNRLGYKVFQAQTVRATHLRGDTSLKVFFHKTAWRSLGMFGMLKNTWMIKPVVATLAHLFFCMLGVVTLLLSPFSPLIKSVLCVALFNGIPFATLLYRRLQTKRFYAPLKALLLYHIYFLARIYSLSTLVLSMSQSKPARTRLDLHRSSGPIS